MKDAFSNFMYSKEPKETGWPVNEMNLWLLAGFSDSVGTIAMVAVQVLDFLNC